MLDNAEDYLLEYINDPKCSAWTAKVIKVFLSGHTEENVEELAKDLIKVQDFDVSNFEVVNNEGVTSTIVLKELQHISGVNALADNQKIKLSENVNVIYGLNGTGKSSYFRILNEMVGGRRETPILPNVYKDEVEDISVKLKYLIDGCSTEEIWDGTRRAINGLLPVRVFDSKYTESMLKKRDSDELVVKPYGLNIFEELIAFIAEIAASAEEIISDEEKNIPEIQWDEVIEVDKKPFDGDVFSEAEISKINNIFDEILIADVNESINKVNEELAKLQSQNPDDKLKIQKDKLRIYQTISNMLEELNKKGMENNNSAKELIAGYKKCKADSDSFRKQIAILNTIPGSDSQEWKNFIAAGDKYSKKVKQKDKCPYCHRPYDEKSLEIVKAYAEFIENDAEQQLKSKAEELAKERDLISQWNTEIVVDEASIGKDLFKKIKKTESAFSDIKKSLISCIDTKGYSEQSIPDTSSLKKEIDGNAAGCEGSIELLMTDSSQKAEKIRLCNDELAKYKSRKSILEQKSQLLLLIQKKNIIYSQKESIGEITKVKTNLSKLGNKAHQELLTTQLQSTFSEILQDLIKKPIYVELKGKSSAGKQQTELAIKKEKNVTNILSEGEQKAAALALFLAEIKISRNKSTIIFDDPVNSLDHKIIGAFTDQLMDLDNQLIIFTHNKLFLDSIETTSKAHVCKTIDSACNKNKGKHIFLYETQSEGISRKGVIAQKAKEDANLFLSRAEEKLNQSPLEETNAVCANLRQAIEEIIDEVVFNKLSPNKFSNKNGRINWDELKNLNPDTTLIDTLHEIHGRCSGGELHLGAEREENPVDKEELLNMCRTLRQYAPKK